MGLNPAWIALIFPIDRILDMCRTVVNVTGDGTVSALVAQSEGRTQSWRLNGTTSITRAVWALSLGLACTCAIGQCEPELPREKEGSEAFLKKPQTANHAQDLSERIAWLEEALEIASGRRGAPHDGGGIELQTDQRPSLWMDGHVDSLGCLETKLCPEGWPEAQFLRGALSYINEDYDNAVLHFSRYLEQPESDTRRSRRREAEDLMPELTFLQQYHAHADRPHPCAPFGSQPTGRRVLAHDLA